MAYQHQIIATIAVVMVMWAGFGSGSPLKHHDPEILEAKELLFNRTMAAKVQKVQKMEAALNSTLQKLTEAKNKFDEAKNDLKEKVLGKVAEEVEKWAAVGDKLQQAKTEMKAKLAEKWEDIKDGHHNKTEALKNKIWTGTSTTTALPVVAVNAKGDLTVDSANTLSPLPNFLGPFNVPN